MCESVRERHGRARRTGKRKPAEGRGRLERERGRLELWICQSQNVQETGMDGRRKNFFSLPDHSSSLSLSPTLRQPSIPPPSIAPPGRAGKRQTKPEPSSCYSLKWDSDEEIQEFDSRIMGPISWEEDTLNGNHLIS